MQTHIAPVEFDYDRLIAPLIRERLDGDRVVLLEGAAGCDGDAHRHDRRRDRDGGR